MNNPPPRISSRCPACGFDTLTLDDRGHLICTWLDCPNLALMHQIGELPPIIGKIITNIVKIGKAQQ